MWDDWLCNSHTGWSPAVMNPMNTIVAMLAKSWPRGPTQKPTTTNKHHRGASPDRCQVVMDHHGLSMFILTSLMIHDPHPWWSMINDDHYGTQGTNLSRCLQENSDDDMEGGLGWITIELKTGALLRDLFVFSLKQPVLEINSVMTCRLECRHCSVCNIDFQLVKFMVFPCLFTLPCCSIPRIFCWYLIGSSGGEEEDPEEDPTVEVHGGLERTPGGGQMGYTHNNDGDIIWNWFMNNSW